jgi:hypothetical protein
MPFAFPVTPFRSGSKGVLRNIRAKCEIDLMPYARVGVVVLSSFFR